MNPRVDVVVVLWKSLPFLEALFESFATLNYPRDAVTIHIVDNASPDGAGKVVKAQYLAHPNPRWPKIILHEPGSNLGFAAGNNLVLKQSTADYAYLLNHDATFTPDALKNAVAAAEAHQNAGAIQSLITLAQNREKLNSTGNQIHFAGFGFCDGYLEPVATAPKDVKPIMYASGAAALYRMSALKKVGLFDETLFMYHEDLELGWRLRLAGYGSLLAPASFVAHHYEFSRSIQKWEWMERNRWIVLLTHFRIPTLIVLAPALVAIEVMVWMSSIASGWVHQKARVAAWFCKPSSWKYLFQKRRAIQALRTTPDHAILKHMSATITHQDGKNRVVEYIANPLMRLYFSVAKAFIRW